MNSSDTLTLPPVSYDECLISSCLKKLFKSAAKSEADTGYVICNQVSDIKGKLELLNINGGTELSYQYLSLMERSMPGADFRYVIVHKGNKPILFTYFQLFTLTSQNFNLKAGKTFVKGIVNFFLNLEKAKALISGNALRNETPCYCFDAVAVTKTEATEMAASIAEKIAADEHVIAVILRDIPFTATSTKWLARIGYQSPMADRVMVLDMNPEWATLPGYVAALARKYKTRANKVLALRNGLTIAALSEEDIVFHQQQINKLYSNVTDNQSFVLATMGEDCIAGLKRLYKNNFELFGFFLKGELIAFYSAFVTPSAYELYYVGFDYHYNEAYQLYFNLLFSGLERAILLHKTQLKLGRTSFDSKASLGAKPAEMSYFIKTANVPNVAVKWFVNYFSSMEDAKWKLRNPLK